MKSLEYFPETDTLHITLSSTPASGGAENAGSDGEHQDIILSYNDKDKLVSITIENASKGVDLNDILSGHAKILQGKIETIYSISELAAKLDITPRTLRNTIHSMRASGIDIGKQYGPTYPIILSEPDAQKIVQWRNEHPRGRPKLALESKQHGNSYGIAFKAENMESHSAWQYLAPADRETFISGTICWLMDPKGDHGLDNQLLSVLLEKLELSANTNSELTIRPEVTESRDKRFDIGVYENDNLIAVFEVKCKTFGSREQIENYAQTQTRLGRIAFDEWNFPYLNEDERTDYPLITFAELADEISRQTSTEEHPFVSSFAYHLKQEAEFFQKLRDFFIEETEAEPPKLPTIHRFSDRFCNQLFWHWFKEHSRKRNLLKTKWMTKSEQSGVWFSLYDEKISLYGGKKRPLPVLNLELHGSFDPWIHIELDNKTGILAEKDEVVGSIQMRITEDKDCRNDLFQQIIESDLGYDFHPPKRRPSPTYSYWTALHRPLKLEDFRFSKLRKLIALLIPPE